MNFRETVMSWLGFTPKRQLPPVPDYMSYQEQELEQRIREAAQTSEDISNRLYDASEKQQKRTEDVKVVMKSVMARTGTIVSTAEEALDILNRAGRE